MALTVETGTITFPSSDGTVQVNLSNFDSSNPPKAIIFFGEPRTSSGGATRHTITWCLGLSDGTTHGCTLAKARNNVGTTVTHRIQRWDAALVAVDTSATNAVVGLGVVSALGDDTFDVTFSGISGGGGQVYSWVAIGGAGVQALVSNWAEQEDDETDPKFVNTGFTPSALITTSGGIFVATADDPEDDGFQTSLRISHSFSVASDRYCTAWGDLNNNSNQQTTSYTENVSGISNTHSGTGTTANARMTATPTSGGFTVTLTNEQNTSAGSYRHTTLALTGVAVELHERTSPTSTGNEDIATGLDEITAVLALGNGIPKGASSTAFGRLFFGAFDGTSQVCRGAGGTDNADPSNNYSWWTTNLVEDWFSSSSQNLSASASVVTDTTIRLNWATVAGTGRSFALLAFGPLGNEVVKNVSNHFGWTQIATHDGAIEPTLVDSVSNDRPDWPSLSGPIALLDLPAYTNNLATDSPQSEDTGLTHINDYRVSGSDQTSDTRRPQGIALKDGIILTQWYFRSGANLNKNKLILIDPDQGSIGRWRNVGLVAVNPATNKFEAFAEKIGGIGVIGNYLYCVATESGVSNLRVFDLREFYELASNSSAVESTDTLANTYPYFLPQVGQIFLDLPEGSGAGWMSAGPDHFLLGNFYDPANGFTLGGKSMIWVCETKVTGAEFLIPGAYEQIDPEFPDGPNEGTTLTRLQGGILVENVLILSRSWSTTTFNLTALNRTSPSTHFFCGTETNPKVFADQNWLWGCEGICLGEDGTTFLTVTEFVNARNVSEYDLEELLSPLVGDLNIIVVSASNSFGWAPAADHNHVLRACSNHFGWGQFTGRDYFIDIIQYFGWTKRVVKGAINHFGWQPRAGEVFFFDASNSFGWTDEALRLYLASNHFGWTQLLVGIRLAECSNSLGLRAVADSSPTNYGREGAQRLFRQIVTYKITGNRCLEREYAPMIGGGEDGYDEMPPAPTLGTGSLTLSYPPVSPTHSLTLRNPNFGNSADLSFRKIDRRTRGGQRIIFADPKWAEADLHTLGLEEICSSDWLDLVDFMNASLGEEINILDWEGRNWRGVLVAPETEVAFVQSGYTVTLQFQGEVVE